MINRTLTSSEETITITDETVKIANCSSFQNVGKSNIRWSTEDFSTSNEGSVCEPLGERLFGNPTVIYFRGVDVQGVYGNSATGIIQARKDL